MEREEFALPAMSESAQQLLEAARLRVIEENRRAAEARRTEANRTSGNFPGVEVEPVHLGSAEDMPTTAS